MRAYLKLLVIVLVAAGGQWLLERNIGWLDGAQFTARIMLAKCLGCPLPDAQIEAEASAMITRQFHRDYDGRTPSEEYEARRAAGEFRQRNVSAEDDDRRLAADAHFDADFDADCLAAAPHADAVSTDHPRL